MRVDAFDFALPPERIASAPASPRESARLLHIAEDRLADRYVRDVPGLLTPGDVLVLNDTRVIPARLYGRRGEARIELLLHKPRPDGAWSAFARPAKRLKPGDFITISEDFELCVEEKTPSGEIIVSHGYKAAHFFRLLEQHGHTPLPPYIARPQGASPKDRADYQTCYAARDGSVAAPTAGLHFTPTLLAAIRDRGVHTAHVTLHVGGGTFLPVKAEDTGEHIMHSEWGEVTPETVEIIETAKTKGGRVMAVGTTSLRILESAASSGRLAAFSGETDIFITPGYRFRVADRLMTNFHLPRSTLFMLVSAFCGLERMQQAYRHAIAQEYRFYSYGDACLLERREA